LRLDNFSFVCCLTQTPSVYPRTSPGQVRRGVAGGAQAREGPVLKDRALAWVLMLLHAFGVLPLQLPKKYFTQNYQQSTGIHPSEAFL